MTLHIPPEIVWALFGAIALFIFFLILGRGDKEEKAKKTWKAAQALHAEAVKSGNPEAIRIAKEELDEAIKEYSTARSAKASKNRR